MVRWIENIIKAIKAVTGAIIHKLERLKEKLKNFVGRG